jgi:hypothetical protein
MGGKAMDMAERRIRGTQACIFAAALRADGCCNAPAPILSSLDAGEAGCSCNGHVLFGFYVTFF